LLQLPRQTFSRSLQTRGNGRLGHIEYQEERMNFPMDPSAGRPANFEITGRGGCQYHPHGGRRHVFVIADGRRVNLPPQGLATYGECMVAARALDVLPEGYLVPPLEPEWTKGMMLAIALGARSAGILGTRVEPAKLMQEVRAAVAAKYTDSWISEGLTE
jgi:hypothetical protein